MPHLFPRPALVRDVEALISTSTTWVPVASVHAYHEAIDARRSDPLRQQKYTIFNSLARERYRERRLRAIRS